MNTADEDSDEDDAVLMQKLVKNKEKKSVKGKNKRAVVTLLF
jgi:hypothetical protein